MKNTALALSAVSDQLDGRAVFFAVPNEKHAAIAPEKDVNALDVVSLARSATGMLRSTFRDEDCSRVGKVVHMGSRFTMLFLLT